MMPHTSHKINADFRRGSLARGLQMRVGLSKMKIFAYFTCYIFRIFTPKATIILCYVVPQWLFSDTEIDDLE